MRPPSATVYMSLTWGVIFVVLHGSKAWIAPQYSDDSSLLPGHSKQPALSDEDILLDAEVTFRKRATSLSKANSSSFETPELMVSAFCDAIADALPVLGFPTLLELYTSMNEIGPDLDARWNERGIRLMFAARHMMGSLPMSLLLNQNTGSVNASQHARLITAAKIVSDAAASSEPLRPGLVTHLRGGPLHGAMYAFLTSSGGSLAPGLFWTQVLSLCQSLFGKAAYADCLHGAGHGAVHNALVDVDGARADGTASCPYWQNHNYAFSRAAVGRALATLQAAPARGLAHGAARGMWMSYWELRNDDSEIIPDASSLLGPNGTSGIKERLPYCPFESDLTPACFVFMAITEPNSDIKLDVLSWTAPPDQMIYDCLHLPMRSERNVRGCLFGLFRSSVEVDTLAFTGESAYVVPDQRAALKVCSSLDNSSDADIADVAVSAKDRRLRALACIAGIAEGCGTLLREYNTLSVAVSNTIAHPETTVCSLMSETDGQGLQAKRWSDAEVAMCQESWDLCSTGQCKSPLQFLGRFAEVVDA